MLDDSLRIQENPQLLFLLSHYAQQGADDRATWRDRLMQMEGVEPRQLSALHGGLREYRRIYGVEVEEEAPEKPRFPRKKKQKSDSPEAVALAVAASE